eukprot:1144160-Pelagomonas_calceolata.AAC.6
MVNLQHESLADQLLVKHAQPAITRLTTSKQDKFFYKKFVPSTHWRSTGTRAEKSPGRHE